MTDPIARGKQSGSAGPDTELAEFVAARNRILGPQARPGSALREALGSITDAWVSELFRRSGAPVEGSALVAVGGYGRGTLSPGSDLDLLLLHSPGLAVGDAAQAIWYPIWDAGLRLDHSVRDPAAARKLATADLRVLVGLLDSRTVAGNPQLLAGLRSAVFADWRASAARRLPELRAEVSERVATHGELAYLLEPNLKESYGGLREMVILRALAAAWVTDVRHESVAESFMTLLDVRDALHLTTGRASDRLALQDQEPVARLLGLADADELMRAVSAAARRISYSADLAWSSAPTAAAPRRINPFRRRRPGVVERTPLVEGVVRQGDEVVLAQDARPDRDPTLLLRAAAAAAQAGLRLGPHTLDRLAAETPALPVPWPAAARDALVSLLGAGAAAIPVWEALDQADLIERLIPPWSAVRFAPQRNPVHTYTVDRHLVQTAVVASGMTRRVARPDLLLVAALLHDIGKGRRGDHTELGVAIMQELAPMLGYDEQDSATLTLLVAHHLLLPDTATRRDLTDPATTRTVAEAVGNSENLDLLWALTEADAAATGPAAWSQWKAALIEELVERTRAELVGASPPPRPQLTSAQLELADRGGVQVLIEPQVGTYQLTVALDDRVGLLAVVAGVLAVHRLAVRSAKTQTVGLRAVTTWVVAAQFGTAPDSTRLREDIRLAFSGAFDIETKLKQRAMAYERAGVPEPPPPRVELVPAASQHHTVVEVRAHDSVGLLHSIARAISGTGVTIDAAIASTLGSEAVDVFYLADAEGARLGVEVAREVKEAILTELRPDAARAHPR